VNDSTPRLLRGWQTAVLALVVVAGGTFFALALGSDPARGWGGLLLGNFYVLAISLSAVAFLAMHDLSRATWHAALRRVPEAMASYVPLGALGMLALGFGIHALYEWSHEDHVAADPVLLAKSAWLDPTWFLVRTVGYVALWVVLAWAMVRGRAGTAAPSAAEATSLLRRRSVRGAVFAIAFVLSFSFASMDWLQSLEPHWYSTLYPWYVLSSVFVGGLAFVTLLVIGLRRRGALPGVQSHHLHDLGKYLFAFSCFWGYLWFCQYMLIWYANIPEEVTHYVARTQGGWGPWFFVNPAVNLVLPLFALLPVRVKKNDTLLGAICVTLVAGHWLDLYLLVGPPLAAEGPRFGGAEIGIPLACVALLVLLCDRALARRPMLPAGEPHLAESLRHHG